MKQLNLGLNLGTKFLDEIGRVVPWRKLVALITPFAPESKRAALDKTQVDQARICGIRVPTKNEAPRQVRDNCRAADQSSADILNKAFPTVSTSLPKLTWPDVNPTICPVMGSMPGPCPIP